MYAKSEYDRHVNSFSNEGRILQIEYAMKAMNVSQVSSVSTAPLLWVLKLKRVWFLSENSESPQSSRTSPVLRRYMR